MGKKYFFSYSYEIRKKNEILTGFGNAEMTVDGEIASIQDIAKDSDMLNKNGGFTHTNILYWREFEPVK